MENQLVLVLDFGGQYNQLIARRVRECGVYCEVIRYTTPLEEITARKPVGIIFTGGPNSVYDEKSPHIAKEIFEMGIPILGICYGCQLMAYTLGGTVTTCTTSEYGKTETIYDKSSALFGSEELPEQAISWMSHTDYISEHRRLYRHSTYRELPGGCHGKSGKETVCRTVPPGGKPHPVWSDHAGQFPEKGLRLHR